MSKKGSVHDAVKKINLQDTLAKRISEIHAEVSPINTNVGLTPRTQLEELRVRWSTTERRLSDALLGAQDEEKRTSTSASETGGAEDNLSSDLVGERLSPLSSGKSDDGRRRRRSPPQGHGRTNGEDDKAVTNQSARFQALLSTRAKRELWSIASSPTTRHLALLLLATAPFYTSISYRQPFIDEGFAVTRNKDVTESRWADIWAHDFWGWDMFDGEWTSKSYRPLVTMSFAAETWAQGNPEEIHLGYMRVVNCAVHSINTLLVYAFTGGHIVASLCFAWHPVHVENIIYLVGRADALATTFLLIAFCVIRRRLLPEIRNEDCEKLSNGANREGDTDMKEQGNQKLFLPIPKIVNGHRSDNREELVVDPVIEKRGLELNVAHASNLSFVWIAICTVCAGLCKETAFTLPILVAFCLLCDNRIKRAICFLAYFLLVFGVRSWFVGGTDVGFSYVDTPVRYQDHLLERFLSYLQQHSVYGQILVLPFHLSWDYSYDAIPIVKSIEDVRILGIVSAYLFVLITFTIGAYKRHRTLLWGAAWVVVPFVPASNLFFLVGTTVGERLLYPCTVGWILVLSQFPKKLILPFMIWYAYRSFLRLDDWEHPAKLFERDHEHWDRSAKVSYQNGVILLQTGDRAQALEKFEKTLEIFDDNALADYMIARIHNADGNCKLAMERFNKIQDGHGIGLADHNRPLVTNEFAFAHVCNKNYQDAVALFESELTTTKSASYFLNAYAMALNELGYRQKAINAMQDAIALFPTHVISWLNFGLLCYYGGLRDHFVTVYQEAALLAGRGGDGGRYLAEIIAGLEKEKPLDWIFFHQG